MSYCSVNVKFRTYIQIRVARYLQIFYIRDVVFKVNWLVWFWGVGFRPPFFMKELVEDWTVKGLCPITGFKMFKAGGHKEEYKRRKAKAISRAAKAR